MNSEVGMRKSERNEKAESTVIRAEGKTSLHPKPVYDPAWSEAQAGTPATRVLLLIIPTSAFPCLSKYFPIGNRQDAALNGDGENDSDTEGNGANTADKAGYNR